MRRISVNNYIIKEMTEEYAKKICTWKYKKEYAVYNLPDYNTVEENKWGLSIKEKRDAEFVAVVQNNELIAYGRITTNSKKIIIGVGLRPKSCGKGYGKDIMKILIEECKKRYPEHKVTLKVRTFNKRAIKCYL